MKLVEETILTENPENPSTEKKKPGMPVALLALTVGAFAIGTTEFVIMGLLPNVAGNLHISLQTAGWLVSGYALGVVVGAPLLTAITGSMRRKSLLLLLMIFFIIGNLISALAPDFTILLIGRIIASLAHGAFFGVGSVIAAKLVMPDKQGQAIGMMITGLTVANVLGVPLGTFLGQNLGWRSTFWMVTIFGIISILGILLLVPQIDQEEKVAKLSQQMSILKRPQVILALLMTVFGFGGVFTVFTYITPILQSLSGFRADLVSPILVLFGVGLVLGNVVGAKAADRWLMPSLTVTIAALAAILIIFSFVTHNQILTLIMTFLFGATGFGTVPGLQLRVVSLAKEAPEIASALNVAAFNLGNAGGAFLGGIVVSSALGLADLPLAGALVAVIGVLITIWSSLLDRRQVTQA
jgi:MFS transporter, DHA1 family, inner membrane transport protein